MYCMSLCIETVQGPCPGNQKVLIDGLGLTLIKAIVSSSTTFEWAYKNKSELNFDMQFVKRIFDATAIEQEALIKAIVLAESLVEGPNYADVISAFTRKGCVESIANRLKFYTVALDEIKDSDKEFYKSVLNSAVTLYKFYSVLTLENPPKGMAHIGNCAALEHKIGRIEFMREGNVEPYIFIKPKMSRWLTEADRNGIIWSVDRGTQGDKLEDFHAAAEDVYYALKLRDQVNQSFLRKRLTSQKTHKVIRLAINVIAILLQFLLVLHTVDSGWDQDLLDNALDTGGMMLLVAQALKTAAFIVLEGRIGMRINYQKVLRKKKQKGGLKELTRFDVGLTKIEDVFLKLRCFVTPMMLYDLLLIGMAVLGTIVSPYWFAFQMIDLVIQSEVLVSVLKSLTTNWPNLLLTFGLILLTVYYYSIFGFLFFSGVFHKTPDNPDTDEILCSSIISCWSALMSQFPSGGEWLFERMTEVCSAMLSL